MKTLQLTELFNIQCKVANVLYRWQTACKLPPGRIRVQKISHGGMWTLTGCGLCPDPYPQLNKIKVGILA